MEAQKTVRRLSQQSRWEMAVAWTSVAAMRAGRSWPSRDAQEMEAAGVQEEGVEAAVKGVALSNWHMY